jgi:hypothetical protein
MTRTPASARPRAVRALAALAVALLPLLGEAGRAGAIEDGAATIVVEAGAPVPEFPRGVTFPIEVTSDEEIVDIDLLYRPAFIETLNESSLAIEPGTAVTGAYELDLGDGSMPPGIDLLYRWRVTGADGDSVETAEQAVTWEDTRFAWEAIASPRVEVFAYNGDPAYNEAVLASAEATIDRLSERFGAEMTHPVRIWVYNSRDDFIGSLAPNSEPWIVGAAYPPLGLINAVLPPGDMAELGRVIPHEISHQVLYQATKNPFNQPPGWLEEGLATLAQEGGTINLWRTVQAAAREGRLDHLRVLGGQFPYDSADARLAYGESMSVVTYIIDTYGEEPLAALIAVLREGITYDDAVQRALGVSLDQLNDDWQAAAPAQADRELARLGADAPAGGFTDFGGGAADLLASGALIMGIAAILGVFAIIRVRRNARRAWDDLDDDFPGDDGYPVQPSSPRRSASANSMGP